MSVNCAAAAILLASESFSKTAPAASVRTKIVTRFWNDGGARIDSVRL
jgi:hypothetical protein